MSNSLTTNKKQVGRFADAMLDDMTVGELKTELACAMAAFAQNLTYIACIVVRLEKHGEEISDIIRRGFLGVIRWVIEGKTTPEIIVKFLGDEDMLERVVKLPLETQQEILLGKLVMLVVRQEGQLTHILKRPDVLSPVERERVFDGNGLRTEAGQRTIVEKQEREKILREEPPINKPSPALSSFSGTAPAPGSGSASRSAPASQVGDTAADSPDSISEQQDTPKPTATVPPLFPPPLSPRTAKAAAESGEMPDYFEPMQLIGFWREYRRINREAIRLGWKRRQIDEFLTETVRGLTPKKK